MKQLIYILSIVALISGCTSTHHLSKKKSKHDTTIVDKSETNIDLVDKTTIESSTQEKADTVIHLPADHFRVEVDPYDTVTHFFNSGTIAIQTKLNPKTKKQELNVTSSPKPVHVQIDKKTNTVQKNDVAVKSDEKKDLKQKGSAAESDKEKDSKTTVNLPWYVYLLCFLFLLIAYIIYKTYKKFTIKDLIK